jgi:hypothetical protein
MGSEAYSLKMYIRLPSYNLFDLESCIVKLPCLPGILSNQDRSIREIALGERLPHKIKRQITEK